MRKEDKLIDKEKEKNRRELLQKVKSDVGGKETRYCWKWKQGKKIKESEKGIRMRK